MRTNAFTAPVHPFPVNRMTSLSVQRYYSITEGSNNDGVANNASRLFTEAARLDTDK